MKLMDGKIAFALAALALMAGTAAGATPGYCKNESFVSDVVMPLVGVSFALMLFLLAVYYMASQFFRRPEYEGFVSVELGQLLVSALLIITVFSAAYFSCEAAAAFAGGDPFEISEKYLGDLNSQLAVRTVIVLEGAKMFSQYMASMSFRWGLSVWGVGTPGFPSFVVLERFFDFLLMVIVPFSASLMVQQVILEVIKGTAVAFVLPAGAVLRIFPPTRDTGNFLIAIAIGFQIVYPFTYVMHEKIVGKLRAAEQAENLQEFLEIEGYHNLSVFAFFDTTLFKIDVLMNPLKVIRYLVLQAVFLPALSMIITISFCKGMIKFLGQRL